MIVLGYVLQAVAFFFNFILAVRVLDDSGGSYCADLSNVSQRLRQGKEISRVAMGDEGFSER